MYVKLQLSVLDRSTLFEKFTNYLKQGPQGPHRSSAL